MSPLITTRQPAPRDRERFRTVLNAGPWCWPLMPDNDAVETSITGGRRPENAEVGTALGVSVSPNHSQATLWLLDTRPGAKGDAALESTLHDTWNAAALALPRTIPLAWSSLRSAHAHPPVLLSANTWSRDDIAANHEVSVGGTSFGLTFVLLLASRLIGAPIPGDLVCSTAIDPEGRVAEVAGLRTKIAAVVKFAPSVTRLVVAASQAEDAGNAIAELALPGSKLSIVAVKNVGHALDSVFGKDYLHEALEKAGANPRTRREVVRSFFHLALQGRGEFVYWTPVERAAQQARQWDGLDPAQRYVLEFAEAVAARHERNQGELTLPSPEFLAQWPRRLRDQILPHLVQQSADTGRPDPRDVRELSEPLRARPLREGYLPQLKLEGALARLDAVTGHPGRALETQFELARVYLDSFAPEEVSFPLCECYRLAGVVGDNTAFQRAERLRDEADASGGVGLQGSAYVDLARARARLLLSRLPNSDVSSGVADVIEEVRPVLMGIATNTHIAAHVRWSAARWLRWCAPDENSAEWKSVSDALATACDDPDVKKCHAARVQDALIRLDACLNTSDEQGAEMALCDLKSHEAGLISLLEAWAPEGKACSHVARFYPY